MRAGACEDDLLPFDSVYQKPITLNMQFPESARIALQLAIPIPTIQQDTVAGLALFPCRLGGHGNAVGRWKHV